MLKTIAQPEDVDAPSDNILVFYSVHILPGEFEVLPKGETVQMDLGSSSEHVGLAAESFPSALGPHLNGYFVDVIEFFVLEGNQHLLEAVVLMFGE
jgi:hypothetical protein